MIMSSKGSKQINMTRRRSSLFLTPFGRLDKYTFPEPNTGCWLWGGAVNVLGYGMINIAGKFWLAHRFSFYCHTGTNPNKMAVCHKCDVPGCVNPDHLFLGTWADNIRDRDNKQRVQRGERHVRAKLSEIQVLIIRDAIKAGFSHRNIGNYFGVASHTITGINTGKTWKHI